MATFSNLTYAEALRLNGTLPPEDIELLIDSAELLDEAVELLIDAREDEHGNIACNKALLDFLEKVQ